MLRPLAEAVEKLPENRLRLRQGMVEKKILFSDGASRWEPRLAVLTEDAFLLSREGQNHVLDYVPLTQIDKVVVVTEMERLGCHALGARGERESGLFIGTPSVTLAPSAFTELFSRKESGQDSSASIDVTRIASADSANSSGPASGRKSIGGGRSFLPTIGSPVSVSSSKTSQFDVSEAVFNVVNAPGLEVIVCKCL